MPMDDGVSATYLPIADPVPVASADGELLGAAWLEGRSARQHAVAFASWEGTRWGPRELVAPPGPGSQLALTAATLTDGTVLLSWSAYDGEDDEILWSRRAGASWTPPRTVHAGNGVPDITPALVAPRKPAPGGPQALVAWSRYQDGQYRVVVASFDGRSWSDATALGPPGSLFPSFQATEDSLRLLFRTSRPRGWQVLELDAGARPRRSAQALTGERHLPRPDVTEVDGALRFSWDEAEARPDTRSVPLRVEWENLP